MYEQIDEQMNQVRVLPRVHVASMIYVRLRNDSSNFFLWTNKSISFALESAGLSPTKRVDISNDYGLGGFVRAVHKAVVINHSVPVNTV